MAAQLEGDIDISRRQPRIRMLFRIKLGDPRAVLPANRIGKCQWVCLNFGLCSPGGMQRPHRFKGGRPLFCQGRLSLAFNQI